MEYVVHDHPRKADSYSAGPELASFHGIGKIFLMSVQTVRFLINEDNNERNMIAAAMMMIKCIIR
jgi:hypothetical protein